jgi:hypothetical protein
MTDKEKAKAYDEALEIAKNEINIKGIGETVELCERLFPELREGEDDKIRKTLTHIVKGACGKYGIKYRGDEIGQEELLAYLEKQKEQKPVEIHIDNPNVQKVDPDVKVTTSDSSADGKELLYVSNKSYDIGFRDGVASVKPAEWSEEDEKMLHQVLRCLDPTLPRAKREEIELWLKSLNPSWKPSEEQMYSLGRASTNEYLSAEQYDILVSLYEQLKNLM